MASQAQPSDESLVRRMASRDQEALSLLYDRHRTVVFSLALRVLRDRAEAEEVLTDVFMQAWRSAEAFDHARGSVAAWLIMLCRSRAIDRHRAQGRRVAATEALSREEEGSGAMSPHAGGPEDMADTALKRRKISEALGRLSPQRRDAIELAYYGGFSHAEIAKKLGEPLGTVKTWIRQGLMDLRQSLAGRIDAM